MIDYLPVRADALLLLVAVALYAADLARLLCINEVLFTRTAIGGWKYIFPGSQPEIARRYLVFANPLDPSTSMMRIAWPRHSSDINQTPFPLEESNALTKQLLYPRVLCTLLLPQIFFGMPLLYILGKDYLPLAILVAAVYLQIVTLAVWLFRKRAQLSLPWTVCVSLTFESLICIPYAINLHRKIAERLLPRCLPHDVVSASKLLLSPQDLGDFRGQLMKLAQDLFEREPDGENTDLGVFLSRLKGASAND